MTGEVVERVIRYQEKIGLSHAASILGGQELWIVHETHHHLDGSRSETYYLECSEDQYRSLRVYGG